jgi:hypothetical protein
MPEENVDSTELDPKTNLEKEEPKDPNPIHSQARIKAQIGNGLSRVVDSPSAPVQQRGVRNLGVPEAFMGFMDPIDLNKMVEGGEYEAPKTFQPFDQDKTLSNPFGINTNLPNSVSFHSRLAELRTKDAIYNYEDELEENQGFFSEYANAGSKFAGHTLNYVGQGLVGFVWGVGKSVWEWDSQYLMDNEVFRSMDATEAWIDRRFVVHGGADYRKLVETGEANVWDRFLMDPTKVFSDDIVKLGGFVTSVILTELAATAAAPFTGGASLAANTARVGMQGARLFRTGVRAMRGLDVASDLAQIGQISMNAAKFKNIAGTARGIMTGAGFESAMIGRGVKDRVYEKLIKDHKEVHGKPPTEEELEKYEQVSTAAMKNAYWTNMPLVAGSNMLQFPKLFIKGYATSSRALKHMKYAGGKWTARYDELGKLGKAGYWGRKTFQRGITEAWEEYAQGVMEEGLVDYYSSNYSPNAAKQGVSYLHAMSVANSKMWEGPHGFDAIVLGGLMGMFGMGMPFRINTETGQAERGWGWHGGAFEEIKQARADISEAQKMAEMLNNTDLTPIMQENLQNFVRNSQIELDKDVAAKNGNKFEFKNKEHDGFHSYVMSRYNQGLAETMEQDFDALDRMSLKDFNDNYKIEGLEEWTQSTKAEAIAKARAKANKIVEIAEYTTAAFEDNTRYLTTKEYTGGAKGLALRRMSNVSPEDKGAYRPVRDQLIYLASTIENTNVREAELNNILSQKSNGTINSDIINKYIYGVESVKKGKAEIVEKNKKELEKEFKEQLKTWEETDPGSYSQNIDEVKQLFEDLKNLKSRRKEARALYDFLFSEKGAKEFLEIDKKYKESFANSLEEEVNKALERQAKNAKDQDQAGRAKRNAESVGKEDIFNEQADEQARMAGEENVISSLKEEMRQDKKDEDDDDGEGPAPAAAPASEGGGAAILRELASEGGEDEGRITGQRILEWAKENKTAAFLHKILDRINKTTAFDVSGIRGWNDVLQRVAFEDPALFAEIQKVALQLINEEAAKSEAKKEEENEDLSSVLKNSKGEEEEEAESPVTPGNIIEEQENTSTEDEFLNFLNSSDKGLFHEQGQNVSKEGETIILISHDKEINESLGSKKYNEVEYYKGRPRESTKKSDEPINNVVLNDPNFLSDYEIEQAGGSVEVLIKPLVNKYNLKTNKEGEYLHQNPKDIALGVFYNDVYLGMLPSNVNFTQEEYNTEYPDSYLELRKKAFESGSKGITHTLISKMNTRLNTQRDPNTGKPLAVDPSTVIEDAQKKGAYFTTKEGNEIPLDLWLISAVNTSSGPELKTNGLSREIIDNIYANVNKLNEGHIYMLVPHPKGLVPVRLFSNPLNKTNEKTQRGVVGLLKNLKENAKDKREGGKYSEARKRLQGLFHKVLIDYSLEENRFVIATENPSIEAMWGSSILPDSDTDNVQQVFNAMGDMVVKVHFSDMNNKNQQKRYTDQGFITTDAFTDDGGSFFHSSGFKLDSHVASKEAVEKTVEKAVEPNEAEKAVIEKLKEEIAKKNAEDNSAEETVPSATTVLTEKEINRFNKEGKAVSPTIKKVYEKFNNQEEELTVTEQAIIEKYPRKTEVVEEPPVDVEVTPEKGTFSIHATRAGLTKLAGEDLETSDFRQEANKLKKDESVIIETTENGKKVFTRVSKSFDNVGRRGFIGVSLILPESTTKTKEDVKDILDAKFEEIGGEKAEKIKGVSLEYTEEVAPIPQKKTKRRAKGLLGKIDVNKADDSRLRKRETEKENGKEFNEREELEWLKDKLGEEAFLNTRMFNTLEELREYLPNDVYEMLIRARKNGKNLHGLFTNAAIYLNNNAFEGTAYHEAFHVVFHLALPVNQQVALLKEAREKYKSELKKDASDLEVEELLADKFMEYVRSDGATAKTLSQKIKNWFKSLFRMIKVFFNGKFNMGFNVSIDTVFENIQLGIYKNKPKFQNTNLTQLTNDPIFRTALREEQYENPAEEIEALDYLRHTYFSILDLLRKDKKLADFKQSSDSELINYIGLEYLDDLLLNEVRANKEDVEDTIADPNSTPTEVGKAENLLELFETLERVLTNGGVAISDKAVEGIYDLPVGFNAKKPQFMRKFYRHLKADGLKISGGRAKMATDTFDTDQVTDESALEESTKEENWQKGNIEVDPKDTVPERLKRMFNSIPKYDSKRKDAKVVHNAFAVPVRENGGKIFAYLGRTITNSTEGPEQMMRRLEALQTEKPYIRDLITKLNEDDSLKSDLYINLASKQFIKFLTVLENAKGEFITFFSNRKDINTLIKEELIENFLNEGNILFNKEGNKGRNFESINQKEVDELDKRVDGIIAYLNDTKNTKEGLEERLGKSSKQGRKFWQLLEKLITKGTKSKNVGFSLTSEQIRENIYTGENPLSNLKRFFKDLKTLTTDLKGGKNPFLMLKAEDNLVKGKKSVGNKNVVEALSRHYKRIFDKDVQDSHRNVENKTVYNIQLANYLSRKINKLKDKKLREQIIRFAAEDPLLSSSPFMKELQNNSKSVEELEIALLDGFKRDGKNKGVKYTKLSPIELAAASMGAFKNEKDPGYSYYKMPIPADSPTIPFIKMKRYTTEEIIDNLVEIARGEYNRMQKLKNLPKDSRIFKTANFSSKANKFTVLSFLNGKVSTTKKFNKKEVRSVIEDYMNNTFFNNQLKEYQEKGIINTIEGNKVVFSANVLDVRERSQARGFFKDYIFNSFYSNIELGLMISGDPAYYNNTVNYQKRNKQGIGSKLYLDPTKVDETYSGVIIADEEVESSQDVKDALIEVIKNSEMTQEEKDELSILWSTKEHNETDGQTYLHPRRYKQIMEGLNRWSDEKEEAYQRVLKGEDTLEDAALFPPIKPFMFTKIRVNGFVVPLQIKNSEIMLTPALALAKEKGKLRFPKLAKLYNAMETRKIDTVMFESAVKVGGIGVQKINERGKSVYATGETIEKADIITIPNSDFGLQQETPPHYLDDLNKYGTQLRHLIIADLNMEGRYIINGEEYSGKEVADLYQETIVKDLEESFRKLEKEFTDKDGEIDYIAISETLQNEIDRRDLGDDAREALSLYQDEVTKKWKTKLPVYHPIHSVMIQNILNGLFRKNVTRQTTKGGAFVNTSSYGLSNQLTWRTEGGKIIYEVMLPWWSKKFFPKNKDGEVDLKNLPDSLKRIIGYRVPTEDKYSMFNMEVVGFTPPSMGGMLVMPREITTIAGLDFDIDKIYAMLPSFNVNRKGEFIKVNPLTRNTDPKVAAKQIYTNRDMLEKFLNDNEDNEKRKEEILYNRDNASDAIADNKKLRDQIAKESFQDPKMQEVWKEINEVKLKKLSEKFKSPEEISKLNIRLNALYEVLQSEYAEYDIALEQIYDNNKRIKEYLEGKIAEGNIDLTQYNGRRERDNLKIDIITGILENPHTAESIVSPGGFESKIDLSAKIRLLKAGKEKQALTLKGKSLREAAEKLDDADQFNIFFPSTQLELFERNMSGKELVGIFANQNTHHAKAQFTQMALKEEETIKVLEGEKVNEYRSLHASKVNGKRISKDLSSYLAAVVDNANVPISSFLNVNAFTADTVALMSRLGMGEELTAYLLNQPVIIELTQRYLKEKGSISEENLFSQVKDKLVEDLKAAIGEQVKDIEWDVINKQELRGNVLKYADRKKKDKSEKKRKEYLIAQYKAFRQFQKLYRIAAELSESVQASRVDTTGMPATLAGGYVLLDKQRRLIEKVETNQNLIEGITQTFEGDFDGNQIMMPSFNKNGLINPLALMDKMFPYNGKTGETGEMVYNLLGTIKNWFSNQKGNMFGLTERETRLIEEHYMGYIASKFEFFSHKEGERIVKETPKKLKDFKRENPNSMFNPLLDSLYVKPADKQFPLPRIDYYKTGSTPLIEDLRRKTFRIMLTKGTQEEKELALDLIKYYYHTTAFEFTPFSFSNIIPTVVWTNEFARQNPETGLVMTKKNGTSVTFNEYLEAADNFIRNTKLYENPTGIVDRFAEEGGTTVANDFIHQFIRNNFDREAFVKTITKNTKGVRSIKASKDGKIPERIAIKRKLFSPFNSFSKEEGMVTYVKRYQKGVAQLFQFSYVNEKNEAVYNRIQPLGSRNFLKVYNMGEKINNNWITDLFPKKAKGKGGRVRFMPKGVAEEIAKGKAAEALDIINSATDNSPQLINEQKKDAPKTILSKITDDKTLAPTNDKLLEQKKEDLVRFITENEAVSSPEYMKEIERRRAEIKNFEERLARNAGTTTSETTQPAKTLQELKLNERLDSYGDAKVVLSSDFNEGARPKGRLNAFKDNIINVADNLITLADVNFNEFDFITNEDKKRLNALKPIAKELRKVNLEISSEDTRTTAIEKRYAQLTNQLTNEFVDIFGKYVEQQLGKSISSSKPTQPATEEAPTMTKGGSILTSLASESRTEESIRITEEQLKEINEFLKVDGFPAFTMEKFNSMGDQRKLDAIEYWRKCKGK